MDDLKGWMEAFQALSQDLRSMVGAAKDATVLLPNDSPEKQAFERSAAEVEASAERFDALVAQHFGYNLCQCTFPPSIMLSTGAYDEFGEETFKCPRCDKKIPPPDAGGESVVISRS